MSDRVPKVIIHGGAGPALEDKGGLAAVREDLHAVVAAVYQRVEAGDRALDCAIYGCRQLEDRPRFNAGYGSVLQADGQARLSAGLMNGAKQRFSGVINAARVEHPIDLAAVLQANPDRVLSESGVMELARELGLPPFDPITPQRLQEWLQARQDNFSEAMAGVVAADPQARRGTIGVVVLDRQGQLAVGTSTGGKGLERLGRVSDAAMPAGTYANALAAVSCTGIGEDIIDECLAARLVVRISDGLGLGAALAKSFSEATLNQRDFGAIAITQQGEVGWGKTSDVLLAAYHTGSGLGDTLDLGPGTATGVVSS
jgi:L-asparaginase